jgi:hypothetical protein
VHRPCVGFFLIKKGTKNAEFHADFKSVGKILINALKKVISQTILMNLRKKLTFNDVHQICSSNNFFVAYFYFFFNGFEISMKFRNFLKNFIFFSNNICLKAYFILFTAKTILKVVVGVCCMQTTYILQCNYQISVFFYLYVINSVNLFPSPLFEYRHCTDIIFYLQK